MEKITFECETITPMFMYGVDGKTPELRPASIKGVMRFWWRAIHGNLSLDELKRQEGEIFGSTDKKSSFSIKINAKLQTDNTNPLPHKKKGDKGYHQKSAFKTSQTFQIEFLDKNLDLVKDIFILTTILGGFGQRSRRGFGSIVGSEVLTSPNSQDINDLIQKINPHFKFTSTINYPYIKKSIQVGKTYSTFQTLLETIGRASHANNCNELGFAKDKNRLASPIYVSVLKFSESDYRPIITTLKNTKSNSNGNVASFKKAIL
jgi:CRISPR-associated protein Cmr1